jgi:hypothetical protein
MLSFIHLSDIHFRTFSGDPFDIDEDLRSELIYDISHNLTKEISSIDGILVCGDIAFSGQAIEYKVAMDFLERICDLLKIDKSHIFCVPGNHDVDQNITRSSASVKALQDKLEQTKNSTEFDWQLSEMFRNTQDSSVLYSPITCYNENFATIYGCSLAPNRPTWKQEMDFEGDYKLCIVGINSTIISNHEDHRNNGGEKLMRISEIQIPSRKENTIFLAPQEGQIEKRVECIDDYARHVDANDVCNLVNLYYGLPIANEDLEEFASVFIKKDPSFSMRYIKELSLLAGAVLLQISTKNSKYDSLAELLTLTTSFYRKPSSTHRALDQIIKQFNKDRINIRERSFEDYIKQRNETIG